MDHTPGFLKIVDDARPHVREITLEEARVRQAAGARLVDVREDDEWRAGHAAGAEHIGKGVIERDIETKHPDKDQTLYLYCGGGFRSALAADALRKMGYRNVVSIDGGWRALQALLPVE